jgi:hypothetical protein
MTSLRETDSGLTHDLNIPMVASYSGTDPTVDFAPFGMDVTIIKAPVECSPCHILRLSEFPEFPIVRYDGLESGKATEFVREAAAQGRPMYTILGPYEVNDAMQRVGGSWTKVTEIGVQKIEVLQLVQ